MEDSPFYSVSGLGQQRMIQQEHSAGDFLSGDKSNRWKRGSSDYESCNPDVL